MRISLRKLAVFDAVARHASVSRGAHEVALSQSAASMALKELEEDLGNELFQRSHGKLILNENGRRLQPLARSLLAQAREIERLSPEETLSGTLHIMASDNADYAAHGTMCAAFVRANPEVRVNLEVANWGKVLDAVESMKCDLGFVEAPCNRPGLEFEPISTDELVIFASPHNRLASRTGVSLEDLAGEQWCLRDISNSCRGLLTMIIGAGSPSLPIALTSNQNDVLKAAVSSGLGLGFLPKSAIRKELEDGALVAIDFPGLSMNRVIGLISPKRVFRGAVPEAFRRFVARLAADSIDGQRAQAVAVEAVDKAS